MIAWRPFAVKVLRVASVFPRMRLRWLLLRLDRTSEKEVQAALRRSSIAVQKLFPAAIARLRLFLACQAVQRRNPAALREQVESLNRLLGPGAWQEETARQVGQILQRSLEVKGPGAATALATAFEVFCEFRRDCSCLVPEAFPVIARLAQQGHADRATGLAYVEFLTCVHDRNPDHSQVVHALRTMAGPDNAALSALERDELNRVVKETLGYPWASLHLLRAHHERGDLDLALKELDELRARGEWPDAPEWDFQAGLLQRALRKWTEARHCFETVLCDRDTGPPPTGLVQRARVYAAEARLRQLDETLHRHSGPVALLVEQYEALRGELEDLVAPLFAAQRVPDAWPVWLELQRRLLPPSQAWQRLAGSRLPASSADLTRQLALLLLDTGLNPGTAVGPAWQGRWLLTQGRLHQLPIELTATAPPPSKPELLVLHADYLIRTGQAGQVREHWLTPGPASTPYPELVLAVRVELLLARGEWAEAERLLQGAEALRLPWCVRQAYLAEAAQGKGDWRQAWGLLREVLSLAPSWPPALLGMALQALLLGRDNLARDCFRRGLSRQPENVYFRLGQTLAEGRVATGAAMLRLEEPAIAALARPWTVRLAGAGRDDLAGLLRQHLGAGP